MSVTDPKRIIRVYISFLSYLLIGITLLNKTEFNVYFIHFNWPSFKGRNKFKHIFPNHNTLRRKSIQCLDEIYIIAYLTRLGAYNSELISITQKAPRVIVSMVFQKYLLLFFNIKLKFPNMINYNVSLWVEVISDLLKWFKATVFKLYFSHTTHV